MSILGESLCINSYNGFLQCLAFRYPIFWTWIRMRTGILMWRTNVGYGLWMSINIVL